MSRALCRWAVGLVLVPYVVLLSTFAPEHVHEGDSDHPHATVHRHLQPHHAESLDHDGAEIGDHDGHVLWLDDVTVHQAASSFPVLHAVHRDRSGAVPPARPWTATLNDDVAPPHGPPRAGESPRAPPRLSA